MSELESGEIIDDNDYVEVTEESTAEPEQEASELAPDSEGQHEPNDDTEARPDVNQEAVNEVINRKHREMKEAQERAAELEKKLKQYEQTNSQAPQVPPEKDYLDFDSDSDYKQYLKQREEAISKRAEWEVQQRMQQESIQRQQYEEQQRRQAEVAKQVESYTSKAKELKIDSSELQGYGNTVASYGMSDDLAIAILGDPDGPLITKYLATNPVELQEVVGMSPIQAALHIERSIKPKATQLRPRKSDTPTPPKSVEGASVDPDLGKYQHIKGGSFS